MRTAEAVAADCAVCGSGRARALPRFRADHLVRCVRCHHVFAGRRPSDEELRRHYENSYGRDDFDSPITRARYAEIVAGFAPFRRTNRLLDVGAGVGYLLEVAAAAGWEAHGTETTDEALAIGREKGFVMERAPIAPGAFPPGSFDVVTAIEVVEHVVDPRREAAVIADLLRPGGLFYCTTPNFDSLSRRVLAARWWIVEYPEHLNYFTVATLTRWLAGAGLRREEIATTGVDLGGLRRTPATAPATGAGEGLRTTIEERRSLQTAKRAANAGLSALRLGDTLKGRFVRY